MENIYLHVSGTSKIALLSEYNCEYPLNKSGKIYDTNSSSLELCKIIDEVSSGAYIINSKLINDDIILFTTPYQYFIYNGINNIYVKGDFDNLNKDISDVKLSNNGISYLEYKDNSIILHKKTIDLRRISIWK